LGKISYGVTEAEKKSIVFRRSFYISQNMNKGDILTPENLKAIRPGLGISPKYYDILIGKAVNRDVKRGSPMNWELLA
jgi:N-acetylneuraminate synthase